MKKETRKYLQNKEYNVMLERLLMLLKPDGQGTRKVDFMDDSERKEIYGNDATTRVYNFSNEYLDDIFSDIDINGGRAFVVGSSGDQALHCIQKGAKEVTVVDGNMWTKPFVELKLAAVKNLNFREFSQYMSYDCIFDPHYYAKVSHGLSPESQAFWDGIMLEFGGHSLADFKSDIDLKDEFFHYGSEYFNPDVGKKENNYYMTEEGFGLLKKNLPNCSVNIEIADFDEFPEVAKGQYDLIMLSNILDYAPGLVFFSVLEALNDNHLTENGQIQAYYTFGNKEAGKASFLQKLEAFTSKRQGKNIRLNMRDVSETTSKWRKILIKPKSSTNIMMNKSDFGRESEN